MRLKEEIEKELDDAYKELGEVEGECGKFIQTDPLDSEKISSNNINEMKDVHDKIDKINSKIEKLNNELEQCIANDKRT